MGIDHWQINPEFRTAAMQYCILGSAATRTRFLFIRTGSVVMALRSIPMLPKRFAVNPTSRSHYDDFGRGPLCIIFISAANNQSIMLSQSLNRPQKERIHQTLACASSWTRSKWISPWSKIVGRFIVPQR